MTDVVLVPITAGHNLSAINNNFTKVQNSINNDVLNLAGGNNTMSQDIDLNGHSLLNPSTDTSNPNSIVTLGQADSRYYNVVGDSLTGPMNVNGQQVTNLPIASVPSAPVRKQEFDAYVVGQGARDDAQDTTIANNDSALRDYAENLVAGVVGGPGFFLQDGAGAVGQTFQEKMRERLTVFDFMTQAQRDDVVNNTALLDVSGAVNTALATAQSLGVGEVYFRGTLGILSGIQARSTVTLIGDGVGTSKIKTLPGFTGNVYETFDFTAIQLAQPADTADGCPVSYGLVHCTIDGGDYSGAATATTGYGIRLYGRQLRLNNLIISRTANIGMYTEFPAVPVYTNFEAITDTKFSVIKDIEITDVKYEGFVFNGPTDQFLDNIFVGFPANSRFDTYDATGPKTSLLFPGEPIHGTRLLRSTEVGFLHSYDSEYGYAIHVQRQVGNPAIRLRANFLMGESSYGGVFIDANVRYQIALLETHNNFRGPTVGGPYPASAGINPHVNITSSLGGKISNLDIYRDATENGCTGLAVSGVSHDITGNVWAFATGFLGGGKGVVNSAVASKLSLNVSSKSGASTLSVGFEEASTSTNNILDISVNSCATNISLLGSVDADNGTSYKLRSRSASVTGISNPGRMSSIPYLMSEIYDDDGVTKRRNKFQGSVAIDASLSTVQTAVFTHNLIRTPLEFEVTPSVSYDSGTIPTIEWMSVIGCNTTTITVQIKLAAGGSGVMRVNARVG